MNDKNIRYVIKSVHGWHLPVKGRSESLDSNIKIKKGKVKRRHDSNRSKKKDFIIVNVISRFCLLLIFLVQFVATTYIFDLVRPCPFT